MIKFFVDSSFVIEALKGNSEALKLSKYLISFEKPFLFFFNHTVWSEIVYQLYFKRGLELRLIESFMEGWTLLSMDSSIKEKALFLIKEFDLKPNDSLILATCVANGIKFLLSFDRDFLRPAKEEGVVVVSSPEDLEGVL